MKCFYHESVDAVAICRSCGRGLCRDCIAEVGLSCSCVNRCEKDVATLTDLAERGRTSYQKTSATYFRSGVFIVLFGAIMMGLGAIAAANGAGSAWTCFLLGMGVLYCGWGISNFVSARRFKQK